VAEERDEVIGGALPATTPVRTGLLPDVSAPGSIETGPRESTDLATTGADPSASDDPEQIREQIERTRDDMSQTLDELQQRLSPQNLAQQARDTVRDATVGKVQQMVESAGTTAAHVAERAQDTAGSVVERVREYPIPMALAGAGLVWWMMRGSGSPSWADTRSSEPSWRSGSRRGSYPGAAAYDPAYDDAGYDLEGDDRWQDDRNSGSGNLLSTYPLPATLAVAGLGYWLLSRSTSGSIRRYAVGNDRDAFTYQGGDEYGAPDDDRNLSARAGDATRAVTERAGEATRAVKERAGDATRAAKDKVSELGETVSDTVRSAQQQVRDTASQLGHDVSRRLASVRQQSSSQFDRWIDDNPLAVGIVAVAVGALVGLSVPRTDAEDQAMGSSRDALVDRAGDAAQQVKDQVRDKVKDVAREVTTAVSATPATE